MNPRKPLSALNAAFLCAAILPSNFHAAEDSSPDFAREILPILSNKCFACHGPDTKKKTELRLDSYSAAVADRDGVRAINPDSLDKSEILFRIHDSEDPMPPEDFEKQLTTKERDLLEKWIKSGGNYADHWAFVPPKKNAPDATKPGEEIDAFVSAQLKENGADLAPEADRATLARRAALTLTGLPPEPAKLKAFLADKHPDAYGRFVDDLLADPHYGEHQARYWLDAVRYGDTHGLHLDNKRGIYPYRDWVIKALSQNLPLDQFIIWQLAGDLLPEPTLEQQVATGFVRMNPTTAEGGVIPAEFQAKNNFDRTENLGTVMLGMTMICARCHTHKYDPITHTEYYELFAFFNSTAESPLDGNKYDYAPVIKAPANLAAWENWDTLETEKSELLKSAKAKVENAQLQQIADPNGPFKGTPVQQSATDLTKRIAEAEKTFTTTLVTKELPKPRTTKILRRGESDIPDGDPLSPDIPSVLGTLPDGTPKNRLGLAKWLTSDANPLVARVLVNRIWQRTFGYGLVRTPEDFGLQGEQPTHPELLDWLAVELRDSGWNLKHMLRLMVTSKTFRQKSAWRDDLKDPENRLFGRGPTYRLDAEVLRDLGLWRANLLADERGGEGIKPYQPAGLWFALMHPGSNTKKYVADKGEKLYRRSLYVYWKRTSPHPMMTLFDAPARESSCVRRSRSNTSLQSLGLLNETQRTEMARKLAERLLKEGGDSDASKLNFLFTLLASRSPDKNESATCLSLLEKMRARYKENAADATALISTGEAPRDENLDPAELAAWTQVTVTLLASDVAILLY